MMFKSVSWANENENVDFGLLPVQISSNLMESSLLKITLPAQLRFVANYESIQSLLSITCNYKSKIMHDFHSLIVCLIPIKVEIKNSSNQKFELAVIALNSRFNLFQ